MKAIDYALANAKEQPTPLSLLKSGKIKVFDHDGNVLAPRQKS